MKFKQLINQILFYISVPKCSACGKRLLINEKALCTECKIEYDDAILTDCSVCGKLVSECDCSTKYLRSHYINKIIKAYRYLPDVDAPTNQLIYRLKRDNRDDVREFLANELIAAIKDKNICLDNMIITNVPRRRTSIKKYGFDHTRELAKHVAKKLKIEYKSLLVSRAKRDQKQSKSREERFKNAYFDYKNKKCNLTGMHVFLLDDVITTGASMGYAAMLLHGLGAKKIVGVTVAIAYKDEYVPFQYTEY